MFRCVTAARFPASIVMIASDQRIRAQSSRNSGTAPTTSRASAANVATFVPTDMNAVTGVGAP